MKYNIALVIGRFQPFHKGHLFLVKKALEKADKIILAVGSANIHDEYNPLNFQQRKKMLEIMIKAEGIKARVLKIVPLDDFYDDRKWLDNVKKQVGEFDIVIGNSEWVNKILEKAGYKVWRLGFFNKRLYEGWRVRQLVRLGKDFKMRVPSYIYKFLISNLKFLINFKFQISNFKFDHCILGGTFDHFHLGHEKFIETAINQSVRITIGLATEKLYKDKILFESIEDYQTRELSLISFLKSKKCIDKVKIIPLNDIYGSGDKEEKIDAIFVTEETYAGALAINTKRRERGWPMLKIIKVPMVKATDGEKISSERIRAGEIDRQGFIYRDLFTKTLILPEDLKEELRKPQGKVLSGDKLFYCINTIKSMMIIAVGDIIVNFLVEKGLTPDLSVIDFKSRREKIKNPHTSAKNPCKSVINKAGTIDLRAVKIIQSKIKDYLNKDEKQLLVIDGEEDLLALPAIILSPLNSLVLYGQYDLGVVVVKVTAEVKERVRRLLEKFS